MPMDFQGEELKYVRELQHRVEKANSFSEKYRMLWSERGLEIGNLTAQLGSALDEVGRLERSNQTAHKLEVDAQQRYEAEKIEKEKAIKLRDNALAKRWEAEEKLDNLYFTIHLFKKFLVNPEGFELP